MTDRPPNWALRLHARAPENWTDAHDAILALSDRLWDDLRGVWIRARRLEEAAEDATGDAELLAARAVYRDTEAAVDAAFEARRRARKRSRSREAPEEIEQAITAAIAESRAARGTLIEHARRVRRSIRPQLQAIWRARDAAGRSIAAGKGRRYPQLHWGQCNDILARYETAAREAAKRGRLVQPARKHPSQSLYVQIQAQRVGGERVEVEGRKRARIEGGALRGTTWGALIAQGRTRAVRIESGSRPGGRRRNRWALLVLPVGDAAELVRLPVAIDPAHEPPADALVKGVRVVRRGREWSAVVSIQAPVLHPIAGGAGTLYCGVNWRRTSEGLRILDGVDESGVRVRVNLLPEHVASVAYADALQGALDRAANEAVDRMLGAPSEEYVERVAEAHRARDWRALRRLALEAAHAELRAWARGTVLPKDRHSALLAARRAVGSDPEKYAERAARILGDTAGRDQVDGLRRKTLRRREQHYRRAAKWLAERYGRIVVAASDGRKLARVEDPETGERTALPLPARRARQAAAPYSLLSAIRWAQAKAGGEVVEVPAVDASHTCPICGAEMERAAADRAALMLRCDGHGVWDRDHALAMALWRANGPPEDRERWAWHAEAGERSRAEIVRVEAEIERDLRGHGVPHSRLRYVAGVALADGSRS